MYLFLKAYFKKNPCKDCGESNIIVLDFDHVNPKLKKFNVSTMIIHDMSMEKIQKEIDKCEVRCSNCHRIKTARTNKHFRYTMGL